MITEESGYKAVLEAVETVTRRPSSSLNPSTKLISDLGLESIDTIDLLFEIEKRLGLSVNLAEVFQNQRRSMGQRQQFDLELGELARHLVAMTKPQA